MACGNFSFATYVSASQLAIKRASTIPLANLRLCHTKIPSSSNIACVGVRRGVRYWVDFVSTRFFLCLLAVPCPSKFFTCKPALCLCSLSTVPSSLVFFFAPLFKNLLYSSYNKETKIKQVLTVFCACSVCCNVFLAERFSERFRNPVNLSCIHTTQ